MRPYLVTADIERTFVKSNDPNKSSSHVPNFAHASLACKRDETQHRAFVWYGENCVFDMLVGYSK